MYRRKRRDTKVGTIERQYGVDFGVRSDMTLGTLLKLRGHPSLTQLLKAHKSTRDWRRTEREVCKRRDMDHVGGSGAPDCDGGSRGIVEVKDQARPVTAGQVLALVGEPWAQGRPIEMVSESGFSDEARRLARRKGIRIRRR